MGFRMLYADILLTLVYSLEIPGRFSSVVSEIGFECDRSNCMYCLVFGQDPCPPPPIPSLIYFPLPPPPHPTPLWNFRMRKDFIFETTN